MKRIISVTTAIVLAIFMVTACDEEVDYTVLEQQEQRYFDLYIAANYSDLTPTTDGLYFDEYVVGEGLSPDTGDYVLINYVAYTVPNEEVVETYSEDWATDHNIYISGALYGPYKSLLSSEVEGLQQGLSMMKEGGISRLLFKSDLGYGVDGNGGKVSGHESMMYDVQLIEVIKDASAREFDQIMVYLDSIGDYVTIFDDVTETYMYYIPETIGDGDTIGVESVLEVFYTGQLLDDRVFDTNVGSSSGFDVTIGEESVISGWEIGLQYFNYGGKGKLLIPHPLGYGEEGNVISGSTMYSIPPFEALLFDIEVADKVIEDKVIEEEEEE